MPTAEALQWSVPTAAEALQWSVPTAAEALQWSVPTAVKSLQWSVPTAVKALIQHISLSSAHASYLDNHWDHRIVYEEHVEPRIYFSLLDLSLTEEGPNRLERPYHVTPILFGIVIAEVRHSFVRAACHLQDVDNLHCTHRSRAARCTSVNHLSHVTAGRF